MDSSNFSENMAIVVLTGAKGELNVERFDPTSGETLKGGKVPGGKVQSFTNLFKGVAVLYLFL